jgi:hypothetical protein
MARTAGFSLDWKSSGSRRCFYHPDQHALVHFFVIDPDNDTATSAAARRRHRQPNNQHDRIATRFYGAVDPGELMEATESQWTDANQAYLVAEFARLKILLDADAAPRRQTPPEGEPIATEPPPAINRLSDLFGLSRFERDVLLLCAGVELDSKLAALCGKAQGNPQREYATFGLALAAFPDPHWSALIPSRPLRRFRMVEVATGQGLTTAPLRIDERILHHIAGVNVLDPRVEPLLQPILAPPELAHDHQAVADRLVRVIETFSDRSPLLHLCGDDPQGQEDIAALAAHVSGRHLFVLRAEDIPPIGPDLDQLAVLWEREMLLLPGALLIQCDSGVVAHSTRRLIEILRGVVFLASRESVRLNRLLFRFDADKPPKSTRSIRRQLEWHIRCRVATIRVKREDHLLHGFSVQFGPRPAS